MRRWPSIAYWMFLARSNEAVQRLLCRLLLCRLLLWLMEIKKTSWQLTRFTWVSAVYFCRSTVIPCTPKIHVKYDVKGHAASRKSERADLGNRLCFLQRMPVS
jgi:hypothetical protein